MAASAKFVIVHIEPFRRNSNSTASYGSTPLMTTPDPSTVGVNSRNEALSRSGHWALVATTRHCPGAEPGWYGATINEWDIPSIANNVAPTSEYAKLTTSRPDDSICTADATGVPLDVSMRTSHNQNLPDTKKTLGATRLA